MNTILLVVRWAAVLFFAMMAGKLIAKVKMPAILGWLIAGMLLGPYGLSLLSEGILNLCVAISTVKIVKNQYPDVIEAEFYEKEIDDK